MATKARAKRQSLPVAVPAVRVIDPSKRKTKQSPPLEAFTGYRPEVAAEWGVEQIRAALLEHERGFFRFSSLLADHIRRDDRVFATLESRVLAALGLPHRTEPSEATTNKRKAEKFARAVDAWWFECIPESTLAELLRWVILIGFVIGELVWHDHGGEWRPTLRVHHPQHVRFDWHTRTFRLLVERNPDDDGQHEIEITPGDGRWVLFTLAGSERPWMHGAVRALAIPWKIRQLATRDAARRSEIEGIGVRVASVPLDANQERVKRFLRQISKLGAETSVVVPSGYGFDIKAVDAGAAEGFNKLIARCDTAITLTLLGQNLTTQIEGGSYAGASVHARVLLDRNEADVEALATCCHDQIVVPWARFNVEVDEGEDAADLAPWPRYDATPPEDLQKKAQALLTLAQALKGLKDLGVDIRPLLERHELTPVEAEQATKGQIFAYHIQAGAVTLNEIREPLGLPPVEGGDRLMTPASAPTEQPSA